MTRHAIIIVLLLSARIALPAQTLDWRDVSGNLDGVNEPRFAVTSTSHVVFCHESKGVFRSSDGGRTWRISNSGLHSPRVSAIERGLAHGEALCATFDGKLYRSNDDGAHWALHADLPFNSMRILRSGSAVLYAWSPATGVYVSTDGGTRWTRSFRTAFYYDNPITLETDSKGRVFVGTQENGVYRSADDGRSWEQVINIPLKYYKIRIPSDTAIFVWQYSSKISILFSSNFGSSWGETFTPDLIVDITGDGNRLYYLAGLFQYSDDGGKTSTVMPDLNSPHVLARIAPDTLLAWKRGEWLSLVTDGGARKEPVLHQVKGKLRYCMSQDGAYFARDQERVLESHDSGISWHHPMLMQLNPQGRDTSDVIEVIYCWDIGQDADGIIAAAVQLDSTGHRRGKFFATKSSMKAPWSFQALELDPLLISSPKNGIFDVYTEQQIIHRTTNLGKTWMPVVDTRFLSKLAAFLTIGDSIVVVKDTYELKMYSSPDLGRTWYTDDSLAAGTNRNRNQITVAKDGVIYIAQRYTWKTSNAGRTWSPIGVSGVGALGPLCIDSAGRIIGGGTQGIAISNGAKSVLIRQLDSLQRKEVTAFRVGIDGSILAGVTTGTYVTRSPVATAIEPSSLPPFAGSLLLHAPYPNPFSSSVYTAFTLSREENVTIEAYNSIGRKVATIANALYAPGAHTLPWSGTTVDGAQLPPGLYIIRCATVGSAQIMPVVKLE